MGNPLPCQSVWGIAAGSLRTGDAKYPAVTSTVSPFLGTRMIEDDELAGAGPVRPRVLPDLDQTVVPNGVEVLVRDDLEAAMDELRRRRLEVRSDVRHPVRLVLREAVPGRVRVPIDRDL